MFRDSQDSHRIFSRLGHIPIQHLEPHNIVSIFIQFCTQVYLARTVEHVDPLIQPPVKPHIDISVQSKRPTILEPYIANDPKLTTEDHPHV